MNVIKVRLTQDQVLFKKVWLKGTEFYIEDFNCVTRRIEVYDSNGDYLGILPYGLHHRDSKFEEVREDNG